MLSNFFGIPVFLVASAALFLVRAGWNFQQRAYGRTMALIAVSAVIGWVLYASAPDDPRLPPSLTLQEAAAFLPFVLLAVWIQDRWGRFAGILTCLAMPIALIAIPVSFASTAVSMHPLDDTAFESPDHRYTARLIYFDGLTYGYDMVVIKANDGWRAALRGADEIAEADDEGFISLEWRGDHTLVLHYSTSTNFVQQDHRWQDVSLQYAKEK